MAHPTLVLALALLLAAASAANAETLHESFESGDEEFDPRFDLGELVVSFRVDGTVNPAGRVQRMGLPGRPPADPFSGQGHLRLTQSDGGGAPVAVWMDFSTPVSGFRIHAYQIDCYSQGAFPPPSRCDNPLVIEAWSAGGALLGSVQTPRLAEAGPPGRRPGPAAYDELGFDSAQPIASLRILGDSNRSSLDELVVTLRQADPGCGLGAEVLAVLLPLLARARSRGRA